jgi:hypothetical protein
MILRNEKAINEVKYQPGIATQPHLTITGLEIEKEEITAHLSDSRSITIPTA